jgi:hypothetical protein
MKEAEPMTDNIDLYCRLVDEGTEVGDSRLLYLLEHMTGEQIDSLQARLRNEGQASLREAKALETDHALARCGVRVQWPA